MALLHIYALMLIQLTITALAVPSKSKAIPDLYRLPQIYNLNDYILDLNVPTDSFTTANDEYTGKVTIHFTLTNNTDTITLHAHHDLITLKSVTFNNINLDKDDYSVNNETDILNINLINPVVIGRTNTLIIDFTGRLSTTDMYGFYKSSYIDKDGETQYLVTTQFEPVRARRAFPCFDEPGFKSKFTVSITYPDGYNALSNTKVKSSSSNEGITTTIFEQTPKMSTYLLAFIISKFTCTSSNLSGTVPYQVCSRNESADTRNLALDVGPKLLTKFNEFTKYDYTLSNSKMDQVAIPDFNPGAMENWGLVTYREAALLWDETQSSNRYKQSIATTMSHELSHQWFGNLVTCAWWSDVFLNEGFATYFQYYMAHEVLPEWELDKQFVLEQLQSILEDDALSNSLPLESITSSPAEISEKFGGISYNKGGSVLRMLAHTMGLDNFKAGLQKYLEDNKLDNAMPENLWAALDSIEPKDLPVELNYTYIMDSWIKYPGFPLVTVKSTEENTVALSQERFLIGTGTAYEWFIPISYTTSKDENKFENTLPAVWLEPNISTTPITLPENAKWIILNNQQTGYYRVNYDDTLWNAIKVGLSSDNFDGITEINRAQIVDDIFNLAKVGRVPYMTAFEVTEFLADDISYYSWYSAFNEYTYLLRRVGENSSLGKAIKDSLMELMNKLYESVPISTLNATDQIYTHKQVLALTWSCKVGHEKCVEDIQTVFNEFKINETRPDPNLRAVVYCNGLRYSNDKSDWEFLWDVYSKSADLSTEQVTILSALGCSKDESLLKEYLQKTITDGSGIRPQNLVSVFSSVYNGNAEGIAVALDFLTENYKSISDKYQSNVLPSLVKGLAEMFTTEEEVTKLQNFISSNTLPDDFKNAAEDAVTLSESNLNWLAKFEDELREHYNINAVGKINASLLIIMFALIFSKFL